MKTLLLLSILLSGAANSQEYEFNIPMINKPHEVIKFNAESGKTYNWDRCSGQTTQLLSEDGVSCEKVVNSNSGFTGSVDVCVTATKDYLSDPYCFAMCGSESITWGNCTASVSLSEHLEIKNITNTDNRYVGTAEMLCTDGNWSIRSSNCEDNFPICGSDHNTVNNNPSNLCDIGTGSSVTSNANTMNWNCATSANTVACLSYKVALCDNTTFNGCSVGTSGGYTSVVTDTTATWNCINGSSTDNCSRTKSSGTNGVCGSANGGTFSSAPSSGLCSSGTQSGVSGTSTYSWSCTGSSSTHTNNAGLNASCNAFGQNWVAATATCAAAYDSGIATCSDWSPSATTQTSEFTQSQNCNIEQSQSCQPREQDTISGNFRNVGSSYIQSSGTRNYNNNRSVTLSYTGWSTISITDCTAWTPAPSTVNSGETFTQNRTCTHNQSRTRSYSTGESVTETQSLSGQTESQQATGTKPICNDSANDSYTGWVTHIYGGQNYQDGCHANSTSAFTCPSGSTTSCIDVRNNGGTFQERYVTCRKCP